MTRRGTKPHTITQIAAALRKSNGQPSLAAVGLGLTRQAVNDRIRKSPILQSVIADIDEKLMGLAHSGLHDLIKDKDGTTIRWFLERTHDRYRTKVQTSIDPAQIAQVVDSFGTDVALLRTIRDAIANFGGPARAR